jgi:hypothetical protein
MIALKASFSLNLDGSLADNVVPFTAHGDIRQKLTRMEAEMRKLPQIEIATRHYFANGLYAREIVIPKGTILTGKIHRHSHINVISKGDISVLTEEGIKRITAPFTMVSLAGIKRAGYAHEETVWTTFHASVETDLERLEADLITPDYDELSSDELRALEALK